MVNAMLFSVVWLLILKFVNYAQFLNRSCFACLSCLLDPNVVVLRIPLVVRVPCRLTRSHFTLLLGNGWSYALRLRRPAGQ